MISSDVHKTSRNLCKKKKCAWLHLYTPSSPISHVQWPPTTSLEQFLRAIVLIYPQIKLNSQLWHCAFFFFKADSPFGSGTPSDKFPFELAQRERCLQPCVSESQCVWPPKPSQRCTFQLMETRKYILTGHKAKLSEQRTKWKENLLWFLQRWSTAKFV